ncbi:MAG: serine/threonine protein kinase, partial [Puniceicoccales bacterium]|nr:serine/threonine protein kinase [Puniceicoccales bacterium]
MHTSPLNAFSVPSPPPLRSPRPEFRVTQILSAGGTRKPEVFRAVELATGADFILKVLREHQGVSDADLKEWFREAAILREINDPGLVSITRTGEFYVERDGETSLRYGFAMPYVKNGKSLAAVFAKLTDSGTKLISPRNAVFVVIKICAALDRLHSRHKPIIHRDLSCDNVIVDDSLQKVLLCDFGLAQYFDYTRPGLPFAGTLEYKSPEAIAAIIDKRNEIYPRDDVWAAGIILYRLLTNAFPFDISMNVLKQDIKEELSISNVLKDRSPSKLNPAIRAMGAANAEEIDLIVSKALNYDPDERYSARDFFNALTNWHDKTGGREEPEKWQKILIPALSVVVAVISITYFFAEKSKITAETPEKTPPTLTPRQPDIPAATPSVSAAVSPVSVAPPPAPPILPTTPPPPPPPPEPPPPRITDFGTFYDAATKPETLRTAGLEATFYDLAQKPSGSLNPDSEKFWENLHLFVTERQWNDTFLSLNFFRAPTTARVSHIFIPRQSAINIRNSFVINKL